MSINDERLCLAHLESPSVGLLLELCEENFARLLRLAPDLRHGSGCYWSRRPGGADLVLQIESQAAHTTTLRLTHVFESDQEGAARAPEPDARLRVYHDARQVEVLDLQQALLPLRRQYQHPALAEKWAANLFLSKWLAYCLHQGHRLAATPVSLRPVFLCLPVPTCD